MAEKWIAITEVRGSISDEAIRNSLLNGELKLRGCYLEDWHIDWNTRNNPEVIESGTIRYCLRPEDDETNEVRESRLDLVNGVLYFDENDVPEHQSPHFRCYIELEVLKSDLEQLQRNCTRRGRPPVYNWDFMKDILNKRKRDLGKCSSIEDVVSILCQEYMRVHKKSPEMTSVRRRLLKEIKDVLPLDL